MRQLFIIPSVLLALVLSAHALSNEVPITPRQLDQSNYKFAVTTDATNTAVTFHVTITAKNSDIYPDSQADLAVVTHPADKQGAPSGTSIVPFTLTIPIAFHKDKKSWTADFALPRESLKTPGLCFIFSEVSHATMNGKPGAMPSITFYEIKLKEFIKE
jgi:hypothetical protein